MKTRDRLIAEMAAGGQSNTEIGDKLGISYATVSNRLSAVYRELGVPGTAGGTKRKKLGQYLADEAERQAKAREVPQL